MGGFASYLDRLYGPGTTGLPWASDYVRSTYGPMSAGGIRRGGPLHTGGGQNQFNPNLAPNPQGYGFTTRPGGFSNAPAGIESPIGGHRRPPTTGVGGPTTPITPSGFPTGTTLTPNTVAGGSVSAGGMMAPNAGGPGTIAGSTINLPLPSWNAKTNEYDISDAVKQRAMMLGYQNPDPTTLQYVAYSMARNNNNAAPNPFSPFGSYGAPGWPGATNTPPTQGLGSPSGGGGGPQSIKPRSGMMNVPSGALAGAGGPGATFGSSGTTFGAGAPRTTGGRRLA